MTSDSHWQHTDDGPCYCNDAEDGCALAGSSGAKNIREWAENRPELGISGEALDAASERSPDQGDRDARASVDLSMLSESDREPYERILSSIDTMATANAQLADALAAVRGEQDRSLDAKDVLAEQLQQARQEVERLTDALQSISNVLADGTCSQNKCAGCQYEMQEAAELARTALGVEPSRRPFAEHLQSEQTTVSPDENTK